MRTLNSRHYFTLVALIIIAGCKDQKKSQTSTPETTITELPETSQKSIITLEKLEGSPAYTDAALTMELPSNNVIKAVGEVDFSFNVQNYELEAQTAGSNTEQLANSGKGQHIHFILDNQPYSAHYKPNFRKELPEGVHHLVAFLSRSFHESVKNVNSVVVKKLTVGKNPTDALQMDMTAPTLIYSRPKGEYSGKDADNLLLDFFVLNTRLSETGNKVRATINGKAFLITEWEPQVIRGLPKGEVTILLELLDAHGKLIPGPFNSVTRSVILKE